MGEVDVGVATATEHPVDSKAGKLRKRRVGRERDPALRAEGGLGR
jgi:hypothetical protein